MGKYKWGKPDQEIELEDLQKALDKHHIWLSYRAYVIILYWVGCRRSEPLAILKEDIAEKNGCLFISIHFRVDEGGNRIPFSRGKHGQAGGPVEIPLSFYGAEHIKELWIKTKPSKKLFPFCDKTGYNIIKKLFPKKSPHWFRHNRITKLRKKIDGKNISVDDVKAFTGIVRDETIVGYGMKTQEGIHRVANALD